MHSIQIEDIALTGIIRLISVVSENGDLRITSLARKAGMTHKDVANYVQRLERIGLVEDIRKENSRIIRWGIKKMEISFEKEVGIVLVCN